MSNSIENCTLTVEQAAKVFEEFNLFISAFLLLITGLLQYGYATRNRVIYIIKLLIMWLFWPLNIAAGILACVYANGNMPALVAAIILTILAILTFVGYWVQSLRLFKRTRSFWSLSPESNAVGSITLKDGKVCHFTIESIPMVLAPILKAGQLYCEGQWLTKCSSPNLMPKHIYVCTPEKRHVFELAKTFTGDEKLDKKQFATFIYTKQSVDTGDLESVATQNSSLYA